MPDPIILPVAQWAPDMPALTPEVSANILNVYPRTPTSYGPVGSPTRAYNALTARCQGGAAFLSSDGAVNVFAGDANDLYQLNDGAWIKVSATDGGYNCPVTDQWQFGYFNGDVIATNLSDGPQVFNLTTSTKFAPLGGSPPSGRYLGIVKNAFVVLGNTYDPINGNMPQRVWWSAAGDDNSWPTPGSEIAAQLSSGATDLLGGLGWVQAVVADMVNADAVIFMEYGVKAMDYVGGNPLFDFIPVQNARGTSAPYSIVQDGGIAYYYGQDGFYAFDGANTNPIGANRVDKFVQGDIDFANLNRMIGTADPLNKLIWWVYPGSGNVGGNPNRLLCYNRSIDRWSLCEVTSETIIKLLSTGYTLDELYTILGYSLDTLPAPLDSPLWVGGKLQMGLFDTTHTLNFLTGMPLAATVDTQEQEIAPGRRVFIKNSRPIIDGGIPSVSIGHRERQQDNVTFTTPIALNSLGTCPQRISGRYVRAEITVPSSTSWTNISSLEIEAVPQGSR